MEDQKRLLGIEQRTQKKLEADLDHLLKVIRRLETYQEKDEQASLLQKDIKSLRDRLSEINQDIEWKDHEINDIAAKIETSRQALQDIRVQCSLSSSEQKSLAHFESGTYLDHGYEQAKSRYESLNARKSGMVQQRETIDKKLKDCRGRKENFENLIEKNTDIYKPYARGLFFFNKSQTTWDRFVNGCKSSLSLSVPELPQRAQKIPLGGDAVYHY